MICVFYDSIHYMRTDQTFTQILVRFKTSPQVILHIWNLVFASSRSPFIFLVKNSQKSCQIASTFVQGAINEGMICKDTKNGGAMTSLLLPLSKNLYTGFFNRHITFTLVHICTLL